GDLDWIAMKCLEKDRTRRYETANGLASDIQRHLNNEPVTARSPNAAYRFQKLVRRNKVAFAAAGAIAAALVLGLGMATWKFYGEKRARQRAEAAEQEQRRLRGEAQAAQSNATERLLSAYLAQARAIRQSTAAGRRFESLAILAKAAEIRPSLELRNDV